jgi:hypothetical protein
LCIDKLTISLTFPSSNSWVVAEDRTAILRSQQLSTMRGEAPTWVAPGTLGITTVLAGLLNPFQPQSRNFFHFKNLNSSLGGQSISCSLVKLVNHRQKITKNKKNGMKFYFCASFLLFNIF